MNEPKNSRIVARNVATAVEREIYRPGDGEKAVSPDGKWLAFQVVEPARQTTTRLVPTVGGTARDLINLRAPDGVYSFGGLSWTPDGKRVLFVKARNGTDRREVWHVDVESGRAEPTGLSAPGLQYVRLHPDGRQLAYSAGKRQEEIWVIEHFLPPARARAATAARR